MLETAPTFSSVGPLDGSTNRLVTIDDRDVQFHPLAALSLSSEPTEASLLWNPPQQDWTQDQSDTSTKLHNDNREHAAIPTINKVSTRLSPYVSSKLLGRHRASPVGVVLPCNRMANPDSQSSGGLAGYDTRSADVSRTVLPPPGSLPRINTCTITARAPMDAEVAALQEKQSITSRVGMTDSAKALENKYVEDGAKHIGKDGASNKGAVPSPGATYRIPLLGPDGCLLGYRQPSSMFRRQMEVSWPDSPFGAAPNSSASGTPFCCSPYSGPSSPFANRGNQSDILFEEFALAAEDPLCGFPDEESRMKGYLLGPIIGRGGFSTVRKALHLATGMPVAVKVVDKGFLRDAKDRDRVDREVRAMRQLAGHVGIVQLYQCTETPRFLYLVMEYCAGGSLLDYVRSRKRLQDSEACIMFQQLVAAIQHCHSRDIVHRDIKLENILLDGSGGVKLVDFGLCGYFMSGKCLRCHCGSPSYAAPEIVGRLDYQAPPVDIWSAGVVLYATLAGYLPFQAKDKRALSEKIRAGIWRTSSAMSYQAADLVGNMLNVDPDARIDIDGIRRHPWIVDGPRWDPAPHGGVVRVQTPNLEIIQECCDIDVGESTDTASLLRALKQKECNANTATYYLLCEAAKLARGSPPPPYGFENCISTARTTTGTSTTTSSRRSSGTCAMD